MTFLGVSSSSWGNHPESVSVLWYPKSNSGAGIKVPSQLVGSQKPLVAGYIYIYTYMYICYIQYLYIYIYIHMYLSMHSKNWTSSVVAPFTSSTPFYPYNLEVLAPRLPMSDCSYPGHGETSLAAAYRQRIHMVVNSGEYLMVYNGI